MIVDWMGGEFVFDDVPLISRKVNYVCVWDGSYPRNGS